jgi:hypothetical protein
VDDYPGARRKLANFTPAVNLKKMGKNENEKFFTTESEAGLPDIS